ncbi:MAG: hypothetical protein J2P17_34805, partial [Mycobacterium sp.]|nr:hypothetical protein [Mycobacterium sp.]
RRTQGKPAKRALAAVTAGAIIAGLVWAWWPHGNYRPIQPNERGLIQQAIGAPAAVRSFFTLTGPTRHGGSTAPPTTTLSSTSGYPAPPPGTRTVGSAPLRPGARFTATTVWPRDDTQRPTPQHPQLAMVLVPRSSAGPTWVFPFNRPAPPGPGDNQSMAIATRDGSVVYDVAFALVTTTRDTVLNRNQAYAFASCSNCAAVAVSFQVVLIVGNAHTVAPQNVSAAVAYNCIRCMTAAIAIQLDLSLSATPHGSTAAQLTALWKQIRAFGQHITAYSLAEIRAQLERYEQQIVQILQPLSPSSSTSAAPSPGSSGTNARSSPSSSGSSTMPSGSTPSSTPGTSVPSSGSSTSSSPSPQPSSSPSGAGSTTPKSPSGTSTPSTNPAPSS